MLTDDREVVEGIQRQGEDEVISYALDVSAVGASPTSPVVVVKDVTTGTVVTSEVMPVNAPTVDGAVITLSPLRSIVIGHLYRVEVKYSLAGNTLESYFFVQAEV